MTKHELLSERDEEARKQIYDINIKIIRQSGFCAQGHTVGQEWTVSNHTPGGICIGAFHDMYPRVLTLKFGGQNPWEPDRDVTTVACTDADNPVVFQLTRIRE